jgi:hypothetical protein
MLSPSPVPDNNGKPSGAQWQLGTCVLLVMAGIVIVLIFVGVTEGLFY